MTVNDPKTMEYIKNQNRTAWAQSKQISMIESVPLAKARSMRAGIVERYGSFDAYLETHKKSEDNGQQSETIAATNLEETVDEPLWTNPRTFADDLKVEPVTVPDPLRLFQLAGDLLAAANGSPILARLYINARHSLENGVELP